jgi:hypothetical protein
MGVVIMVMFSDDARREFCLVSASTICAEVRDHTSTSTALAVLHLVVV